jgi:hypothetical protein
VQQRRLTLASEGSKQQEKAMAGNFTDDTTENVLGDEILEAQPPTEAQPTVVERPGTRPNPWRRPTAANWWWHGRAM